MEPAAKAPAEPAAKAPTRPPAKPPAEPPTEPLALGPPSPLHRRHWTINAIFALAVLVGVFAVLAVWVNRQVLNTDNWTNTSSRLLADPKIEKAIGTLLVNELFSSVDVAAELKSVLPSEVSGLAAPAADGLRTLANQIAPQVLATSPVQNAWRLANRAAQIQLVHILKGGGKTLTTNNGVVTLQLHPLLVQLAAQLGLRQQFESVQSKLQGSSGEVARGAVQEKLGVKLPPASGGIVILRSSQLKTAQDIVKAIQGLAIVLPLIALLLFVLAVWLADGWRRVALRTAGWCLVAIGLIAVLARRLLGNIVVDALVKIPANRPAAHQAFAIGTTLLYDLAFAMITYGVIVVIAAWVAGHTRPALKLRRALAPSLREHPQYVYAVAALALLLVVVWGPFPSTRELLPIIGFAILIALGIHVLRGMTADEFPNAQLGDTGHALRDWYSARRHSLLATISTARSSAPRSSGGDTRIGDLERLANLHDRGVLTDEEFSSQKTLLLKPISK
jgi:Short C-terminal domain